MLKQSFYEADEIRLGSAFGTFTTRCPPLGSTATNMLQVADVPFSIPADDSTLRAFVGAVVRRFG